MSEQLTETTPARVYPDTYEGVARTDERFTVIAEVFGNGTPGEEYEGAIEAWEEPTPEGMEGMETVASFDAMITNGAMLAQWVKDSGASVIVMG